MSCVKYEQIKCKYIWSAYFIYFLILLLDLAKPEQRYCMQFRSNQYRY